MNLRNHTIRTYALGVVTGAMLTAGVTHLAAPADAAPDRVVAAYAAQFGGAVCATLNAHSTINGIYGVGQAIIEDGLTARQAGAVIALSVIDTCPWHLGLLDQFIDQHTVGTAA